MNFAERIPVVKWCLTVVIIIHSSKLLSSKFRRTHMSFLGLLAKIKYKEHMHTLIPQNSSKQI